MNALAHFGSRLRWPMLLCTVWCLAAGSASVADAQSTLYWSSNNSTQGGNGTWSDGGGFWGTVAGGPWGSNWNNANNDTAVFGGAAGTVTLGTGITVGGLQFDTAGYLITGGTLTFGAAGDIVANTDAEIASIFAGSAAVRKRGNGTLTLSSNNTYSGSLTLSAGAVLLNGASGAITSASGITLNPGATFTLSNTSSANNGDRIGTGGFTSNGGTFNFTNDASDTAFAETMGTLTLNRGALTLATTQAGASGTSNLTISSISRSANGGTVLFSGAGFGVDTRNQVLVTTALSSANLGGIIPWALIQDGSTYDLAVGGGAGAAVTKLPSYDSSSGATTWGTTAPGVNARPGAAVLLTGAKTINSLVLGSGINFTAPAADRTITIGSGTQAGLIVQTGGTSTIANSGNNEYLFAYGTREAIFNTIGTLVIQRGNGNVITTSGGMTKAGAGTLQFGTASNNFVNAITGTMSLNEGLLNVFGSATTALIGNTSSAINFNGGNLTINATAAIAFNNPVTINSDATLTSQRTTASGAGVAHTFGTLGIGGSTLTVIGGNNFNSGTAGFVFGTTTLSASSTFNVVNQTTVTGVTQLTLGAVGDGGSGYSITKTGNGTLALNTTGTYSGGTTLNGGTLTFSNNGVGTTGAITFAGNSTLQWGTTTTTDLSSRLVINNGVTATIDTNGNDVPFATGFGGSGSGALAKIGAGNLTLSGSNSFSGGVTLGNGTINVDNAGGLGSGQFTLSGTALGVLVGNGLNLTNNITIGSTTGIAGAGLLKVADGNSATLSGPITITGVPANGGHFGASSATGTGILNVTGPVNSSVDVRVRSGTVVFSGGGTYSSLGGYQGTLKLGANNGLSTSATVVLARSAAMSFDMAGFNQSLAGISQNGTLVATVGNSLSSSQSLLTITGTSSYNGVIADNFGSGTGTVALAVNGGNLTLSGASTYTGNTTLSSGTLNINAAGAAGSGPIGNGATFIVNAGTIDNTSGAAIVVVNNNPITVGGDFAFSTGSGTANNSLTLPGAITLTGNRTITTNGSGTTALTLTGAVGDGGSGYGLTKSGAGRLILNNSGNTYGGPTTINGGLLIVNSLANGGAPSTLGQSSSTASNLVFDGGTLAFASGSGNVTTNRNFTIKAGGATIQSSSGSNVLTWSGTAFYDVADQARSLTLGGATSVTTNTFSGILADNGTAALSVTVNPSSGGWTLSNANTYTGATSVTSGTLTLSGSLTGSNVSTSGTGNVTQTAAGVIAGSGVTFTQGSSGTSTLGGNNTYTGATSVTSGTLTLSGLLTGSNVSTSGTGIVTQTAAGVIAGSGVTFTQGSSGTSTLAGTNTYTGGTFITAGTISIGADANLGNVSGGVTLNGGRLTIAGDITTTRNVSVGVLGGTVSENGNGDFVTTGNLTGSGTLTQADPGGGGARTFSFNSTSNNFTGGIVIGGGGSGNDVRFSVNSLEDSANNIAFTATTGTVRFSYGSGAIVPLTLNSRAFEINSAGALNATIQNNNTTQAFTVVKDLVATGAGAKTLTFDAANGPTNVFSGNITNGTGGGSVAIAKTGAGRWDLSSNNSFTGSLSVTSGTLNLGGSNTMGAITVNGSAVLSFGNSGIGSSNATITLGQSTSGDGTLQYVGSNDYSIGRQVINGTTLSGTGFIRNNGSGALIFTNPTFNALYGSAGSNKVLNLGGTNASSVNEIQGVFRDDTGFFTQAVTKLADSSIWKLSGLNTYSGATAALGGQLVAGNNSPNGAPGAFGNASTDIALGVAGGNVDAMILIDGAFDVGRVIRIATNNTSDSGTRVLTLGGNSAAASTFSGNIFLGTTNQAGRGVTLTAASGGQVTFSGVIQDPTGMDTTAYVITKAGAGTVVLSGNNTYTGNTTVDSGLLLTTKAAALPGYTTAGKVRFTGGTLGVQVGGSGWTTSEVNALLGNATKTSGALGIDTTNGSINQWVDFTTSNLGSSLGLTKLGAGTLTLNGTNNYNGATSVAGGTLAVNGSLGNTAVTVGTGGTLQGSGTIGGSISVLAGGTFGAGNSIESLGSNGTLSLGSNSTFLHEIDSGAATGVEADLVYTMAGLNIASGAILNITELGNGTWTGTPQLTLISYNGTWDGGLFTYNGTTLNNGATFNFSGLDWVFTYNGTTAGTNYPAESATGTSFVTMFAVPEPASMALAVFGLVGLGIAVRRRFRHTA